MNFKRYHVSRNLFASEWEQGIINATTGQNEASGTMMRTKDYIPIKPNIVYSFSRNISNGFMNLRLYRADKSYIAPGSASTIRLISGTTAGNPMENNLSFCCFEVIDSEAAYIRFNDSSNNMAAKWLMVEGEYTQQTMPKYEPYSSEVWHDIPHYIHNTSTDTITTLPAVVYPNATTATVGLKGNMSQASGVSPDNPIQPQETGERTGNLFDKDSVTFSRWYSANGTLTTSATYGCITAMLPVSANALTISWSGVQPNSYSFVYFDENGNFVERKHKAITSDEKSYTATTPDGATQFIAQVSCPTQQVLTQDMLNSYKIMLNEGPTALPYEPYGYKIPISSASTTTPIYLGEVETTRKIKKLALTGEETVAGSAVTGGWIITNLSDSINNTTGMQTSYCSHYLSKNNGAMSSLSQGEMCISTQVNNRINFVTTFATAEDFKSYLAAQYAAGTPVTVWYVLATPTTGIVNEPIRKIGDYADTVSGITIPTITGKDTFDVLTTLKPSEVSLAYTGWHKHSPKEYNNGSWT